MPAPTTLEEALKVIGERDEKIVELRIENAILKSQADHSVGGFLRTNVTEKVLLGLVGVLAAALGVGYYQVQNTRTDLHETQRVQSQLVGQQEATAKRVETMDAKISPPVVYGKPDQAPGKWLPKD